MGRVNTFQAQRARKMNLNHLIKQVPVVLQERLDGVIAHQEQSVGAVLSLFREKVFRLRTIPLLERESQKLKVSAEVSGNPSPAEDQIFRK
jgi:hypothetical protein